MSNRSLTDDQIIELDEIIEEMDLPEVGTSDFHHFAAVHFATEFSVEAHLDHSCTGWSCQCNDRQTTAADYAFYMSI